MWLVEKVLGIIDSENSESTEEIDRFMDKEYYGLLQMSYIYMKLDRKHLPQTLLQAVFGLIICYYHLVIIIKGLSMTVGINFILYAKCSYLMLMFLLSGVVIIFAQFKHKALLKFHKRMYHKFYDYHESKTEEDRLRVEMMRERKILIWIPVGTSIGAIFVFILAPLADRYGTFHHKETFSYVNADLPIPFAAYPFSTQDHLGFYIAYIGQTFGGCILPLVIGMGGFVYIVMAQNLTMQLKILIFSLENIEDRAAHYFFQMTGRKMTHSVENMFSDETYDFCYNLCLKKNFEHHQTIISLFDNLIEVYSFPTFIAYLTGTSVIALSLLSTNVSELPGTSMTSILLGVVEVGFMAFFSTLGQRITDLSAELRIKIYDTKWYYNSEKVKRSIRIFQIMTLKPMTLLAGGLIPVNMDTFAKVMNTAYSYYNLVNAFSTE